MSFSKVIAERFVDLKYVSSKGKVFESVGSQMLKAWKKSGPMPVADVFADITCICETLWDTKKIMCYANAEATDDLEVRIEITGSKTECRDKHLWTGVFKMSLSKNASDEISEALYEFGQGVYDQLESRI